MGDTKHAVIFAINPALQHVVVILQGQSAGILELYATSRTGETRLEDMCGRSNILVVIAGDDGFGNRQPDVPRKFGKKPFVMQYQGVFMRCAEDRYTAVKELADVQGLFGNRDNEINVELVDNVVQCIKVVIFTVVR